MSIGEGGGPPWVALTLGPRLSVTPIWLQGRQKEKVVKLHDVSQNYHLKVTPLTFHNLITKEVTWFNVITMCLEREELKIYDEQLIKIYRKIQQYSFFTLIQSGFPPCSSEPPRNTRYIVTE